MSSNAAGSSPAASASCPRMRNARAFKGSFTSDVTACARISSRSRSIGGAAGATVGASSRRSSGSSCAVALRAVSASQRARGPLVALRRHRPSSLRSLAGGLHSAGAPIEQPVGEGDVRDRLGRAQEERHFGSVGRKISREASRQDLPCQRDAQSSEDVDPERSRLGIDHCDRSPISRSSA